MDTRQTHEHSLPNIQTGTDRQGDWLIKANQWTSRQIKTDRQTNTKINRHHDGQIDDDGQTGRQFAHNRVPECRSLFNIHRSLLTDLSFFDGIIVPLFFCLVGRVVLCRIVCFIIDVVISIGCYVALWLFTSRSSKYTHFHFRSSIYGSFGNLIFFSELRF